MIFGTKIFQTCSVGYISILQILNQTSIYSSEYEEKVAMYSYHLSAWVYILPKYQKDALTAIWKSKSCPNVVCASQRVALIVVWVTSF